MGDEVRGDVKENTERIIAMEQQIKTLFAWREEFRSDCQANHKTLAIAIQNIDDRINKFSNHAMTDMKNELMDEIKKVDKRNGKRNGLTRGDAVVVAVISGLTSIIVALITTAAV
jgi:DNA-binding protein H-NS